MLKKIINACDSLPNKIATRYQANGTCPTMFDTLPFRDRISTTFTPISLFEKGKNPRKHVNDVFERNNY